MLRNLLRNRTAFLGFLMTAIVVAGVVFGPIVSPYSGDEMDFFALLAPPSWAHPFGTDSFGRDVLTRALQGGRLTLAISVMGVLLGAVFGIAAGLYVAYTDGIVRVIVMQVTDLLFSFPSFVLALFLMVILGYGVASVSLAIALVYFPIFVRLSRNLASMIVGEPWIQAARLFGQSTTSILLREILPNIAAPLLVQVTIGIAAGVAIEAGLSFIGLGVQPPDPSLGLIMSEGREYFQRAPWVLTMTGLAVSFTLLGLNLLGDGLRDLTDPRLKERLS